MKRTNAVVISLVTVLAATAADAARLPFEVQAPRNQDVQAPRDRQEDIQAPRGLDVQSTHGQDVPSPQR